VLEIGTGTGLWAIGFADTHQSASVLAVDVVLMQPCIVPPNLEFLVFEDWDFLEDERENTYDFVRIAHFVG
jgi:hypothetical protein